MTDSYESALRQVARLLKLADRAATPEEAAVAASKAAAMMERFQIERGTALDAHEAKEQEPDEAVAHTEDADALDTLGSYIPRWRIELSSVLARAQSCQMIMQAHGWKMGDKRSEDPWARDRQVREKQYIGLIGRPSDMQTVRYLYAYCVEGIERLVTERGAGMGKSWRNNFRLGVIETIREQLEAAKRELHRELRTAAASDPVDPDRALTVLKTALSKRAQVAEQVEEYGNTVLHLSVRSSDDGGAYDHSARMAGREAGKELSVGVQKRKQLR